MPPIFLLLLVLAFGQTPPAKADLPPVQTGHPALLLPDNAGLQKQIRLEAVGISLPELLARLSSFSGGTLDLQCNSSLAQQRVQLRLKDRPVSEVLDALADLFSGEWQKENTKTLRLAMKAEARHERESWWFHYLQERRKAILSLHEALFRSMVNKPTVFTPGINFSGSAEAAQDYTDRGRFFFLLPEALKHRIADSILEDDFSDIVRSSTDGGVVERLSFLPEAAQKILLHHPEFPSLEGACLQFKASSSDVSVTLIAKEKPPRLTTLSLPPVVTISSLAMPLDHRTLASLTEGMKHRIPEGWEPLVRAQQKRVWKNDPPTPEQKKLDLIGEGTPLAERHRPDVLSWIALKTEMEFIADDYSTVSSPLLLEQKKQPLKFSRDATLNLYAEAQDFSWKQRETSLYLIRSNRWYRDDEMEVPPLLMKRWLKRREEDRKNEPPPRSLAQIRRQLEWGVELTSQLTIFQIAYGLMFFVDEPGDVQKEAYNLDQPWQPFGDIAGSTLQHFHLIKFYSSLTKEQQNSLLDGRLSLQTLNEKQFSDALRLCPDLIGALNAPTPVLLKITALLEDSFGGGSLTFPSRERPFESLRLITVLAQPSKSE